MNKRESEDFLYEETDNSKQATIIIVSDLLNKMSMLIRSQVEIKNTKERFSEFSKLFKALSTSKNIESDLTHELMLLEAKISANEREKDVYLQIQRANREILISKNMKLKNTTFSKMKTLKKEHFAILHMRKELKLKEISNYLNNRYKKDIKESGLMEYTEMDISRYLLKLKEEV